MAINERAKAHYDQAVAWVAAAEQAAADGESNAAVVATGIATARIDLGRFCVENHALVSGIDDQAPIDPRNPVGGGAKLWMGPSPP
jgi:hypothetical protein